MLKKFLLRMIIDCWYHCGFMLKLFLFCYFVLALLLGAAFSIYTNEAVKCLKGLQASRQLFTIKKGKAAVKYELNCKLRA